MAPPTYLNDSFSSFSSASIGLNIKSRLKLWDLYAASVQFLLSSLNMQMQMSHSGT